MAAAAPFRPPTRPCNTPVQSRHCFSPSSFLFFPSPPASSLFSALSISRSQASPRLFFRHSSPKGLLSTTQALVEEEPVASVEPTEAESPEVANGVFSQEPKPEVRACELYVCNIPRSCDISELSEIFNPYGTVQSVEVSRNSETGLSRGCGYVMMSSIPEAKAAVAALDGSDLGGREMRVRLSADIFSKRKIVNALNLAPKNIVFESPYKAYIGNIAWSVKPEDLRGHFCQFGTVVSARVLYDRKGGKNRAYGFVSFSSADELVAAISSSGMEFCGREMLVREVVKKE